MQWKRLFSPLTSPAAWAAIPAESRRGDQGRDHRHIHWTQTRPCLRVSRSSTIADKSLCEGSIWTLTRYRYQVHGQWIGHIRKIAARPRPADSHKGMFGSIGIIGGSAGMTRSRLLAGQERLKLGAGRVYLGLLAASVIGVDTAQPELMLRPIHALFQTGHLNCLVVGPGLGSDPDARFWLDCALKSNLPLVLDADALNLIAAWPAIGSLLRNRKAPSILTPHPAEAARLLSVDTGRIQQNRMAAAQSLVDKFNCCVVLKGSGSICATPDGKRYINTSGNPGLSSAGTGDILTGMIGAMLAQGASPENSCCFPYTCMARRRTRFKRTSGARGHDGFGNFSCRPQPSELVDLQFLSTKLRHELGQVI